MCQHRDFFNCRKEVPDKVKVFRVQDKWLEICDVKPLKQLNLASVHVC